MGRPGPLSVFSTHSGKRERWHHDQAHVVIHLIGGDIILRSSPFGSQTTHKGGRLIVGTLEPGGNLPVIHPALPHGLDFFSHIKNPLKGIYLLPLNGNLMSFRDSLEPILKQLLANVTKPVHKGDGRIGASQHKPPVGDNATRILEPKRNHSVRQA